MSSYPFHSASGPILVDAEVTGPSRMANVRLIVDTGATTSLIDRSVARYIGLDPDASPRHVRMTTGTTVQTVPVVTLTRLGALGRNRFGMAVIAHSLPATSGVDGLLGLDFFRGSRLVIDLAAGQIEVA
jgi:predicted aspartyl protease